MAKGSVYIPEVDLPNLHKYKYSGTDKSLLSRYVLCHYWNNLVKVFPMWMAPNLITFLGFCFVLVNFATLLYYDPTLEKESPAWVYYSYGLGLWIYASLDAIDGKQARRTGQSGPLGELFDHGCDSLNTTIEMVIASSVFGLGRTWWTVVIVWVGLFNFYLSTMEEYHTGTLYLGYFSGPVEGITISCLLYALTGYVGQSIWLTDYKQLLPLPASLADHLPDGALNHSFVVFGLVAMLPNLINSIHNVYEARVRAGKPFLPALVTVLPFVVASTLGYLWLDASPALLHQHLVSFFVFITFGFGYTVGRMIVAHVTKAPFPLINVMFIPLLLGAANAQLARFGLPHLLTQANEHYMVYAAVAYAAVVYLHFAHTVVDQICDYLDIWCFRIKHKKTM
ncbi:hypothetical protein IWQ60_002827 [Tieghemiomyces parasiticus]|uniref:Choline/ethanolaminephosphotransferase n=1 Tax=Tieghemiomyces parasiticus TaxID=78921 RepID=A0A9W8AC03_9FUNG|nr:hypothetical protein IWQ60_002827 [Tieghemiomyces parasiticus]